MAVLDECEIVVDVGAVYDPSKNRFDHHQRSFTETFSSIDASKPWTIKLSSAGLIYVHFGRAILSEILKKHSAFDENPVEILFDKMYEQFVREIDAIDNGVEIAENRKYEINTNLSARVSYFNPAWNQEHLKENVTPSRMPLISMNLIVKCVFPCRISLTWHSITWAMSSRIRSSTTLKFGGR